jgi:phosphatidate phosphatase APP1
MTIKNWRDTMHRVVHEAEQHFDRVKRDLGDRFGAEEPYEIVAYRDYGDRETLRVRGRVLERSNLSASSPDDPGWRRAVASWKRIETDEVPGARVRASVGGASGMETAETEADEEGYFTVELPNPDPDAGTLRWHEVHLELLWPAPDPDAVPPVEPVTATAHVVTPGDEAELLVVSDIDDTVVETHATSYVKMAKAVLLGNAHTRVPFQGVSAFYRALFQGDADAPKNPLFYVSSSPWNFYDLLSEFFELRGIPAGPLLLRDIGVDETKLIESSHDDHKLAQIERILRTLPHLPVILIGDSGQRDPWIYRQVIEDHPERVRAIYIRDVHPDPDRKRQIHELRDEAAEAGVTLMLIPDTLAAARHAASEGWIPESHLAAIEADQARDEKGEEVSEEEIRTP